MDADFLLRQEKNAERVMNDIILLHMVDYDFILIALHQLHRTTWQDLVATTSQFLLKLAGGVVILLGFWITGKIVRKIIRRLGRCAESNIREVLDLASQVAKISLILLGLITALGTMGINVSALVASLGLGGFALGFALKDALSNLLAGVLILIYQPFRLEDHIIVSGFEGRVVDIDLRYVTLQGENKTILIPNSMLFTNVVTVLKPER